MHPTEYMYHYLRNSASDLHRSFRIEVSLWVYGKQQQALALIDSGATLSIINTDFVKKHHLVTDDLQFPMQICNANGSYNSKGEIRHKVDTFMQHDVHKEKIHLVCMKAQPDIDMILGYDWLLKHNPDINWA